jgi:hypothetical protein
VGGKGGPKYRQKRPTIHWEKISTHVINWREKRGEMRKKQEETGEKVK